MKRSLPVPPGITSRAFLKLADCFSGHSPGSPCCARNIQDPAPPSSLLQAGAWVLLWCMWLPRLGSAGDPTQPSGLLAPPCAGWSRSALAAFRPVGPSAEGGWPRSEGGGLGSAALPRAFRSLADTSDWTACSWDDRVAGNGEGVGSFLHLQGLSCALSSVSPSSSREPAWFQTCCRRRQSWGLSSKTSHCQAAEVHSPRCTDQLAALSRVRIPALRCSQSCSDVSTQGLAKMSRQGTKARKGSGLGVEGREKGCCPLGVCSWASAGLLLRGCGHDRQAGGAGRERPSDLPGMPALAVASGVGQFVLHRATYRAKGDKTFVCNPGKQRIHSLGSSRVWAASEGSRSPGAGSRWCRGKRSLAAKTQKELDD